MGKSNRVKQELTDVTEMNQLIQTLKDIADNKYYTLVNQKDTFRRFGESFVEFFRMIRFLDIEHPMLANDNPKTGIVVVTVEGSFLGRFNNSIFRRALEEQEKYGGDNCRFIVIGDRIVEKIRAYDPDLKLFTGADQLGHYEMAIQIKDYLSEQIHGGHLGRVVICYAWPKDFETQRVRALKLLPCDELISKQEQFVTEYASIIQESDPKDVVSILTNLWITTRLYEIIIDTNIASAAAQASFLEESLDRMKKELKKTKLKYRKAKKADIDKSLRETFASRMMTK